LSHKLTWNGSAVIAAMEGAAMSGLIDGGEAILTDTIDLEPLLSGTMRRSGTVTVGQLPDPAAVFEAAKAGTDHSKNIQKAVPPGAKQVFVSVNTPYARKQHEDPTLKHTNGGAKFLLKGYTQNVDKVIKLANLRAAVALKGFEK
jgi:hypothetical protein